MCTKLEVTDLKHLLAKKNMTLSLSKCHMNNEMSSAMVGNINITLQFDDSHGILFVSIMNM